MATAYLYNKNEALFRVDVQHGYVWKIDDIKEKNRHLFPIIFQPEGTLTIESLNAWLLKRKIPDTREGIKEARTTFRGFENCRNMFGLSDQYWFRYKRTETWDKLNFFTNRYDQEQGKIFFEPWTADIERASKMQGPDLTTNGVLRKRWAQEDDGKSYLLKAGSTIYHQEPLSEVLASITLEKLNIISYVPYELVVYGMRFCSKCPNFVTASTEFVPAIQIYSRKPRMSNETEYEHFIEMCQEFRITGAEDYMQKMITADHIICNSDRHFGNFGFIRSAENGKILGFAPLFDFGRAYWGVPGTEPELSSKYFFCKEKAFFKKQIQSVSNIEELIDTEKMEDMVRKYPELTDKHIENIIHKIHVINKEIENEKPFRKKPNEVQR